MTKRRIFPDMVVRMISLLPVSVLYAFSTCLAVIAHRVVRYRRAVVTENLARSFPDSTPAQRKRWRRRFYRNLTDLMVEIAKGSVMKESWMNRRVIYHDLDLIERLYDEGRSVIMVGGHRGNWEWAGPLLQSRVRHRVAAVYKPLSNEAVNDMMLRIRGRWGVDMVAMHNVVRHIATNRDPWVRAFFADQSPPKHEIQHYMEFLGQDTPVYLGPAKIARSTGHAVVFMDARRKKRGVYDITFELISKDSLQGDEIQICEDLNRRLEKGIREDPDNWLWSHRRWKHSRQGSTQA